MDEPPDPKSVRRLIAEEAEKIREPEGTDRGEVFAFFGLAAFYAQAMEGNLFWLLSLVHLETRLTPESLASAGESLIKQTLGQMISRLRDRVPVPHDLDEELRDVLNRRNELMHGFFVRHKTNYTTDEGRRTMLEALRENAIKFNQMNLTLIGFAMLMAPRLR